MTSVDMHREHPVLVCNALHVPACNDSGILISLVAEHLSYTVLDMLIDLLGAPLDLLGHTVHRAHHANALEYE